MSDSIEAKADRYLVEARIGIVSVSNNADVKSAVLNVRSDNGMYLVKYQGGSWMCDCPARVLECAHVVAAKKIIHFQAKPSIPTEHSDLDELLGLRHE